MEPPSESVIRRIAQALGADEDELINLAGKVPRELKAVLEENPEAVELLRVLSERKLPEITYRQMLDLARSAEADQSDKPAPDGEVDSEP